MKFSVLMSVYYKENAEHFSLALKSNLEEQTVIPDEFVLICDGPLNAELDAVIDRYVSLYPDIMKIYRFEKNRGLGEALKFGIEKCSFELVARSDSDDVCESDRFEKQLKCFDEDPDLDIVGSDIDEFSTDWKSPTRIKNMPSAHEDIVKMAKFRNPINHMTVMFKKKSVLDCGSYQHLPYAEDYYLWVRAINSGCKLANIPRILVHARVGNGMEKRRGNKQYIKSWRVLTRYMRENKMISRIEACKNIVAVTAFVCMPGGLRSFVYKKILRK